MKLILASNNKNKLREFSRLVKDMDIELISQRDAGCDFEVEETGTTFEENSYLKASAVTNATGIAAFADDSGLCVDALGGEPGVYSARYCPKEGATDSDRYNYLLSKLENVENRTARFVCTICCTMPNGDVIRSRGECEGYIMRSPVGNGGFGYDPVFHPNCVDRGMAELTPEEKNAISHRGKALREFISKLNEYMEKNNADNK